MHNKHHANDLLIESTKYGSTINNHSLTKMISKHTKKETKDLFFNKFVKQHHLPPSMPKHDFEMISFIITL